NFGLGPLTLGLNDVVDPPWPKAPLISMLALSCIGAVGTAVPLAMAAICAVRLRNRLPVFAAEGTHPGADAASVVSAGDGAAASAVVRFLLCALALFLFMNCIRGLFDRYLLLALLMLLPCLCSVSQMTRATEAAAVGDAASGGENEPAAAGKKLRLPALVTSL